MKIWLIALALVPMTVSGGRGFAADQAPLKKDNVAGWEAAAPPPQDPNEPPYTWVDSSYTYATTRTLALTQWIDNFFGDPNYDLEKAESLVRLEWTSDWDEEDDYNSKVRLRGKLQLPRISKRISLLFSGEERDDPAEEERVRDGQVGVLFNVDERKRNRLDLTLGVNWDELTPGIRFRSQGPFSKAYNYRYTQRLEYEQDEGVYATGEFNLDHALSENKLLRWSSRGIYGEESDGLEWQTTLSLSHRLGRARNERDQRVFSYFASATGFTDPNRTYNYRLGVQLRRQVYRQFLFMDVQPSYNFREGSGGDLNGAWNIVLRLEIALERDRLRNRASADADQGDAAAALPAQAEPDPPPEEEAGQGQASPVLPHPAVEESF